MTAPAHRHSDLTLAVRDVGLSYTRKRSAVRRERFWALKNISFDLYRGDCLGVVGKNGAGKSSLLKLLANVVRPDYGTVENYDVTVSLLSLQLGFLSHLTGRENALLGGMFQGLTKSEVLDKMDDIIAFSELREFIDQPLSTYSAGMAARLGFAVAFQVQPDVLLVDEVIGVGDASFQERSKSVMKARLRAQDTTIVFVSHSPPAILEMCNRAIWIENHVVQCEGLPDDVLRAYGHFARTGEFLPEEDLPGTASAERDSRPEELGPPERIRIDFTADSSAEYLSEGWGRSTPAGRWSVAEKVAVRFGFHRTVRRPRVRLHAGTFCKQKVLVSLNGEYVQMLTLGRTPEDIELDLPIGLFKQENELFFQLPDRHSPASLGVSTDDRDLGIEVAWMEIEN